MSWEKKVKRETTHTDSDGIVWTETSEWLREKIREHGFAKPFRNKDGSVFYAYVARPKNKNLDDRVMIPEEHIKEFLEENPDWTV